MLGRSAFLSAPRIKCASSRQESTEAALAELADSLNQPDVGLVVVFFSSHYDTEVLAKTICRYFDPSTVIGCSTAGEVGPLGYTVGGITGFSIHRDDLAFEVGLITQVSQFDLHTGRLFAHQLKENLQQRVDHLPPEAFFGFMLIDGLSRREESVARAFHDGLGGIPLMGGSAADDLRFKESWILYEGRCVKNAALLLVCATPYLFHVFKTQHFVGGGDRLVVTGALVRQRDVTEINGCPALEEYARCVGLSVGQLDATVFASYPFVVRIGHTDFVRSIQKINPDGSLRFFCAIEEGVVMRVANGIDMLDNLTSALEVVAQRIGEPALIIGCDCILRHLEARVRGRLERVGQLLSQSKVVGFSTYGEQYRGLHVNQTFTGIAIGSGKRL